MERGEQVGASCSLRVFRMGLSIFKFSVLTNCVQYPVYEDVERNVSLCESSKVWLHARVC